jgi:hypothetical protein
VAKPKFAVRDHTWELLGRALAEYGRVEDEEERKSEKSLSEHITRRF